MTKATDTGKWEDGGPAFATADSGQHQEGMSRLDFFAAHAMAAVIIRCPEHDFDDVATEALGHAHALISALSQKAEGEAGDTEEKEWAECGGCGGSGWLEDQCTCMDDTCCCLDPEPPVCNVCKGEGGYWVPAEGEAS